MRMLMRLAVAAGLIISCSEAPTLQCSPPTTIFNLYADTVRVAVGGATPLELEWSHNGCQGYERQGLGAVQWTVREGSVASVTTTMLVVGEAAGSTVVVARADTLADSLVVSVPDTASLTGIRSIAAGGNVSCAVDAGSSVYCWGSVSGAGVCFAAQCSPMPVHRTTGAERVRVGGDHACVLDVAGKARCWGLNFNGQLGNGSTSIEESAPVDVATTLVFDELALGTTHSCGLTPSLEAYCWGASDAGQVGSGSAVNVHQPAAVAGSHHFVSIGGSEDTTCGATDAGALLCWGVIPPGVLPSETCTRVRVDEKGGSTPYTVSCSRTPRPMPVARVSADTTFVQVSGSCALSAGGAVYCLHPPATAFTEVAPAGTFVSLAGGKAHVCGLDSSGASRCLGANHAGQLGDGTNENRTALVPVAGSHTFTQLAAGSNHTCGLTSADIWCWGANQLGQAGVPVLDNTRTPQRVRGQP